LIIHKLGQNNYLLVVNASNTEKDYQHLITNKGNYAVRLNNIPKIRSFISLQGPESSAILTKTAGPEIAKLNYLHFAPAMIAGVPVTVSRTGIPGN